MYIYIYVYIKGWWLVSTPLKNMSQVGLFFPMYGNNKHVPNQTYMMATSNSNSNQHIHRNIEKHGL